MYDLWHDRKVSFCIAASLVAVIAPLLLLFGLKHGVVNQLQEDLLSDPRNLEVKMLASGAYTAEWIEQLQQMPEVGFAIGQTRSLNTQADLVVDKRHFVENAEVIPTAAHDPLLNTAMSDLSEGQVILSYSAAQRLKVQVGDSLRMRVLRKLNQINERGELQLQVVAVLDAARFPRPAAFVNLPLLIALEAFRDGFKLPELGLATGVERHERPISFSKVRLYASSVDDVAPLTDWLAERHIESGSRLAEIESVKAINQVLTLIFLVIAITALVGCIASLIGAFLANIDRKRKDLAVLRLLGFTHLGVGLYVVIQALLITLLAYIAGLGLYFVASELFNQLLVGHQSTSEFSCQITLVHAVIALLFSMFVAVLVSCIGALRAIAIEPAESLREL
ncbi:FtsX-like permease family protein [Denitrificimonas sp. JX-1]|uniref:FtsX-like permease family protein n=1 Tax=Denitrificimonas halotolerans TaxID=3098930 RepID=A0ABU5GVB5_9GAMM|nr:FtsX-like permease family protein [Denitrificimonas sp. JX-1]MDY7220305.1 FtsX-like permease family protein [Denitrificimonas sp. JX-1]